MNNNSDNHNNNDNNNNDHDTPQFMTIEERRKYLQKNSTFNNTKKITALEEINSSTSNITSTSSSSHNSSTNGNHHEGDTLPSVKHLGMVYQTQSDNHIKYQQILVGKISKKSNGYEGESSSPRLKSSSDILFNNNNNNISTSPPTNSPSSVRRMVSNINNNNNGYDNNNGQTNTTTQTSLSTTTSGDSSTLTTSATTATTETIDEKESISPASSTLNSFSSTSSSSSSSSSNPSSDGNTNTKGWKTQLSLPPSPPTVSRKIRNSYRSSKLIDSGGSGDESNVTPTTTTSTTNNCRSISPTTTQYMNEFPPLPLSPQPIRSNNNNNNNNNNIIDHPISQSYSGPSNIGVGGSFRSFRNHQAHRVAGDWRDKVFTQGVTPSNVDKRERRNLIGSREPSSMSLLTTKDDGNNNESTSSPITSDATTTTTTTTTTTKGVEEMEIQSLVDKFKARKGSNSRKSKLTTKDVEWITDKFDQQDLNNHNKEGGDKKVEESTTTSTATNVTTPSDQLNIKQSLATSNRQHSNNGNINSIGRKRRGKTVADQYVRAPKLSSSSPSSIDSSGEEDDDDEIITPISMPSYRFLEEAGKPRYLLVEPSRKPGIKPPLFLHVPTVAHPIQFHQNAPEKISSSTMTVAVEENVNTPPLTSSSPQQQTSSTSLLYNHQIINRVSHDKDLSYQFFPALKISHKTPHRHHHHMTIVQNNLVGVGVNKNNTGTGAANTQNQNQKNANNNNGNNKTQVKNSPSSTSTSPSSPDDASYLSMSLSPPSSSTSPMVESLSTSYTPRQNEAQRKSYWPIRFGQQQQQPQQKQPSNSNNPHKDGDHHHQPSSPPQLATSPDSATTTSSPASSLGSSPTSTGTSPNNNSNNNENQPSSPTPSPSQTSQSPPQPVSSVPLRSDLPINVDNMYRGIEEDFKDRTDIHFVNNNGMVGNNGTNNGTGQPNVFSLSIHSKRVIKIKCGTVDALVEALTHHQLSDPNFAETFLLTFKTFTTSEYFLSRLVDRYEQVSHINDDRDPSMSDEQHQAHLEKQTIVARTVKLRVCSIIKMWIDKHFYDFEKQPKLLDDLESFVTGPLCEDGMEKIAQNIQRTIQRRLAGEQKDIVIHGRIPPSIIPNLKADQVATLFSFDDLEIARQLTLIEHESYSLIKPYECVNLAFSKVGKEENAPNIWNIIKRSNNIPLWVATEIVQEERLTKRANIIKKFISIADHCRNLNNFNAVMEILSGLNITPVYRLKKTWETISRKYLATFKHLNSLMANKGNFKVYRDVLHTKNPPCLPFLGVYLTDLTFLEEGSPETLEGGLINMIKRTQLAAVIQEIQQFQQQPYSFTPVPIIRDFLLQVQGLQERALYKQSKLIEP